MRVPSHVPLVTVILPVYNGARFVGDAIASALSQTYPRLEVVIVDDGSTDHTKLILDSYAAKDPRIRVISQPNGGVARARNRAIAEAQGTLIAPLDADDLWQPTKVSQQVQRLLEGGDRAAFVYSWWVWIDQEGRLIDSSPRWLIEGSVFEDLLQINFTGNASVPLYRKKAVEEVGGYNEQLARENAGGCEDWELVLRMAERYEVVVVPEVLTGYRRRPGSMSAACETMWRSQRRVLQNMQQLRPGLKPPVLRRASQQFAMYLAGVSFWSGNLAEAFRWGLRAGFRLPLLAAPYVVKLLFTSRSRRRPAQAMAPGVSLDTRGIPEPLLPYGKVLSLHSM